MGGGGVTGAAATTSVNRRAPDDRSQHRRESGDATAAASSAGRGHARGLRTPTGGGWSAMEGAPGRADGTSLRNRASGLAERHESAVVRAEPCSCWRRSRGRLARLCTVSTRPSGTGPPRCSRITTKLVDLRRQDGHGDSFEASRGARARTTIRSDFMRAPAGRRSAVRASAFLPGELRRRARGPARA